MATAQIDLHVAPALGNIPHLGEGDWIYVHESASKRLDWPRYWEAIGAAFVRGARIVPLVVAE